MSSHDPVTGEAIALTVGPHGIEEASSSDVIVSFLDPSAIGFDDNVILTFCSYVYVPFFTSPASGSHWVAEHPATFLLSLEEAFDLGQRRTGRDTGRPCERWQRRRREGDLASGGPSLLRGLPWMAKGD